MGPNGRDHDADPRDEDEDEERRPAIPAAKSVHRCTPGPVLELVYEVLGSPVGIDPCSNPRSIVKAKRSVMLPEDGLSVAWHEHETGFVNPPFGKAEEPRWIQKAIQEAALGWEGILLLPAKTGAPWFEPLYRHSPCICFWGSPELDVEGRIWFHEEDGGATFNTEFVYLGPRYEAFARVFSRAGHLVFPRHDQALTTRITGRTMRPVYASAAASDDLFRHAEREIRTMRYHGLAVGVTNLPHEITIKEILAREDIPELRGLIEELSVFELGQALLLLANEPSMDPPPTTRGKKRAPQKGAPPVDKNQLGLPVYSDGRAYRTAAERERFDDRLLGTVRASKKPLRRADIMAQNPCTEHEYRGAMGRLLSAGLVEKIGSGVHTRYGATKPPRTEQDDTNETPEHGHPAGTTEKPR